jgi:hypothetical protein
MTGIIQEDIKQEGRHTGYMGIPIRCCRCQCLLHAYSNARVEVWLVRQIIKEITPKIINSVFSYINFVLLICMYSQGEVHTRDEL